MPAGTQHDAVPWAAAQLWQLTPVKAVPAKAQARGSRYQGLMLMRYRLTATETRVMPTALQAFKGLTSNTCRAGGTWHQPMLRLA